MALPSLLVAEASSLVRFSLAIETNEYQRLYTALLMGNGFTSGGVRVRGKRDAQRNEWWSSLLVKGRNS